MVKHQHLVPTPKEYEEVVEDLQANKEEIIGKWNNVIAKLTNVVQALGKSHIVITSKKLLFNDDINKVNEETWVQFREALQECNKKIEKTLNTKRFQIYIFFGKMTDIEQESFQSQIHITPRFQDKGECMC